MVVCRFFVILALYILEIDCRWLVEVNLISYRNDQSKAIGNTDNGECCDPPITNELLCTNECDNYFVFCMQSADELLSLESCQYGRYATRVITGGDHLEFKKGTTLDGHLSNPLVFSDDHWPNTTTLRLLTIIYDNDTDSPDLIGNASIQILLSSKGIQRQAFVVGKYYELYLDYTSRCAVNHFGLECNRMCVPQDDINGHYTCSEEGLIVCLPGYNGVDTNCTTANECDPECDMNSFCNSSNLCECISDRKGVNCSEPICNEQCTGSNSGVAKCSKVNHVCQCSGVSCISSAKFTELSTQPVIVTTSHSVSNTNYRIIKQTTGQDYVLSTSTTSTNLSTNSVRKGNLGLIISFAVLGGILMILTVLTSLILIVVLKHHYLKNHATPTCHSVTSGPGDNPNYSVTAMGNPITSPQGVVNPCDKVPSSTKRNNSVRNLDNPVYSFKSPTADKGFIVSGYSLVSLSEDQYSVHHLPDAENHHENGTSSQQEVGANETSNCISAAKKKPATLYYSQPVLNEENDYDYGSPVQFSEARVGCGGRLKVPIIKARISRSERKLDEADENMCGLQHNLCAFKN